MEKSPISNQDLDILLDSHRKYLLREKDGILLELENRIIEGYDFSGKDCENAQFLSCLFRYEMEGEEIYDPETGEPFFLQPNGTRYFTYTNFSNVDFTSSKFVGIFDLNNTNLLGAIFINVNWSNLNLMGNQKSQIVTTVSQLTNKVKEQNREIENQEEQIQKKNETITKTSEKQSKGMLDIFQELQKDFSLEERIWVMFGYMVFSILLAITSSIVSIISPMLSAFVNFIFLTAIAITLNSLITEKKRNVLKITFDEWITIIFLAIVFIGPLVYFGHESWVIFTKSGESWIKIVDLQNMKWEFIAPISILFFSLFWFSVHQYGRAKKLRIEQQNKQAMIHFMQAIVASDGKGSTENRLFPQLAPFFANAIIHRPFSQDNYDPQLPIDEVKKVLDMAKLFQK